MGKIIFLGTILAIVFGTPLVFSCHEGKPGACYVTGPCRMSAHCRGGSGGGGGGGGGGGDRPGGGRPRYRFDQDQKTRFGRMILSDRGRRFGERDSFGSGREFNRGPGERGNSGYGPSGAMPGRINAGVPASVEWVLRRR